MSKITTHNSAFTIIELLIVIAIIGILATITLVTYPSLQAKAKDQKIKQGASKIAEATEEWSIRIGATAANLDSDVATWGVDSTGLTTNGSIGIARCQGGSGSYSWVASANTSHVCTLEDVLVESGYMAAGYLEQLPVNPVSGKVDELYRTVKCSGSPEHYALLFALNVSSEEDDDEYSRIATLCGIDATEKSSHGMRGAMLIRMVD